MYLCTLLCKNRLHTFIHCAAIQKCHGILECRWVHHQWHDHATRDINLIGFWPVTPHQSFATQVQLCLVCVHSRHRSALGLVHLRSLRGSTVFVSLSLVRGRHCDAERAVYWALPYISSWKSMWFWPQLRFQENGGLTLQNDLRIHRYAQWLNKKATRHWRTVSVALLVYSAKVSMYCSLLKLAVLYLRYSESQLYLYGYMYCVKMSSCWTVFGPNCLDTLALCPWSEASVKHALLQDWITS